MKAGEVNSKYIAFSLKVNIIRTHQVFRLQKMVILTAKGWCTQVKSTLDSCGDEIEQNSNILVEDDPQRSTGASDDQLSLSETVKSAELPNVNITLIFELYH
jgi:hypothetical protein